MFMNRWIHWGSAAIAALGLVAQVSAANPEDQTLESFFKRYLDEQLKLRPVQATGLGDHRYDSQLEDVSPQARATWAEHTRSTLRELPKRVDYSKLSRAGQIDFEILKHRLEEHIWLTKNTHPFEEDPRTYGGYINESTYLLLTQSTLPKETNIANCITRMALLPRIIDEARKTLTHPPKPILETAIRQNRGSIGFYEKEIFELAGDTPQLPQLKAAASSVVGQLKDYQKFLEGDLMSRATGEWRLGKSKFYKKFELETEAGVDAGQTLADAETEFDTVVHDMYVVSRQLWSQYFPKKPLPPDDASGRRQTITEVIGAVNQEHGKVEDLVTDARRAIEQIKKFIRERDYVRLPEPDHCQVIEMPEFRRGNSLAYLDNAPPLDPNASSYYAISPPPADWSPAQVESFLDEYNQRMLQILTIHEGYPGHFVQLEYANRTPSLIRRVLASIPSNLLRRCRRSGPAWTVSPR